MRKRGHTGQSAYGLCVLSAGGGPCHLPRSLAAPPSSLTRTSPLLTPTSSILLHLSLPAPFQPAWNPSLPTSECLMNGTPHPPHPPIPSAPRPPPYPPPTHTHTRTGGAAGCHGSGRPGCEGRGSGLGQAGRAGGEGVAGEAGEGRKGWGRGRERERRGLCWVSAGCAHASARASPRRVRLVWCALAVTVAVAPSTRLNTAHLKQNTRTRSSPL